MKKGFVFVETIVVISVVLGALITMYSMYILSNNTTYRRLRYEDVNKLYESYYMQKYLSSFQLDQLITKIKNGSKYEQIFRGRQDLFTTSLDEETAFFENIWEDLKIRSITLFPYDLTTVLRCNTQDTQSICNNKNMIAYLKTLNTKDKSGYRLVFEFASSLDGSACPNYNECFYFYTNIRIDG